MPQRNAIERKANAKGVVFALVTDGATWEVWKLCENYNGKVRGGISKTWRYVEKGMTEQAARAMFGRRTAA
ncbi:hypothetical protein [Burkholderia pseudomallei]|uniref:hypothetical protein n=1 Tax=Burkholderia pseudomallei TaxID=28450 RepID=UPI00050F5067|nr:hypothetical protein [Burkholderia pseudomallei]KGC37670.1 hypothetical protein DO62_5166 [Burkholderia pseudomallei]